ncbi:MAG: phospholipase D family protein, partial [Myxococcota bacterium]
MLGPDDRALYTECLRPPPGAVFDEAVGTSFTLDLETLLVVPLTLTAFGTDDPGAALEEPLPLFDGIRRHADRVTLFCQRDAISVPRRHQPLFGMIEDCIVPVRPPPRGGFYHPKCWIVRYLDTDGAPLLRCIVSSRNLTFDRSWDFVLVLEGRPGNRRLEQSAALSSILRFSLEELTEGDGVSEARRRAVLELASQAERTPFDPPEGFLRGPVFHAMGIGNEPWRPGLSGARKVLVVSPFVAPPPLRHVTEVCPNSERTLVSRAEWMDALAADLSDGWSTFVLSDRARADAESAGEEHDTTPKAGLRTEGVDDPHGLHAKMLIAEKGREARWWLGSANFTDAAWDGHNVELVVELAGTRARVGIGAFLEAGFQGLLQPHTPEAPDDGNPEREEAARKVERTKRVLAAARLRVVAAPTDDERWRLELRGDVPEWEPEVTVMSCPVSLPTVDWNQELEGGGHRSVSFNGLAAASLTALFGFTVWARVGKAEERIDLALKLPSSGFPSDRHAEIVRTILKNREGFFR